MARTRVVDPANITTVKELAQVAYNELLTHGPGMIVPSLDLYALEGLALTNYQNALTQAGQVIHGDHIVQRRPNKPMLIEANGMDPNFARLWQAASQARTETRFGR